MTSMTGVDILLRNLGLLQYFPGKLHRDDFYQINDLWKNNDLPTKYDELPWHFIHKIIRYNYDSRRSEIADLDDEDTGSLRFADEDGDSLRLEDFTSEETSPSIHPLDIVVSIYHCCDPIVRQDLAQLLWGSRLAVPFILKLDGIPKVFLWPLQVLSMQWRTRGSSSGDLEEQPLARFPIKRICAVKVGDTGRLSKSQLLNWLCSRTEKSHSMFFHKDSESSTKERSEFVEGMVEAGWYFPTGCENDAFTEGIMFQNLRGDVMKHPDQVDLLSSMSDIAIVICSSESLTSASETIEKFLKSDTSVLVLLTDERRTQSVIDRVAQFDREFNTVKKNRLNIIGLFSIQRAELVKQMRKMIKTLYCKDPSTLEDIAEQLATQVDQSEEMFKDAETHAKAILELLTAQPIETRKQSVFPLQGDAWQKYADADREIYLLRQMPAGESAVTIDMYREFKERDKQAYRQDQFYTVRQGLPQPTKNLIYSLTMLKGMTKQIFLRRLKLGLDDLAREELRPLLTKYKDTLNEFYSTKASRVRTRKRIKDALDRLDKDLSEKSLGLEHFLREFGQVYETCTENDDVSEGEGTPAHFQIDITPQWPHHDCQVESKTLSMDGSAFCADKTESSYSQDKHMLSYTELPNLAADIVLCGYPVEVLDGEVTFVPTVWIRSVLNALNKKLHEREKKRPIYIHSISVLGIQSSGKSTLLNALFGSDFAVSSGRCTRGVFLHVVKISGAMRALLGVDYLLITDTEGLKSCELLDTEELKSADTKPRDSTTHDHELSVFAIGQADTTVINLMGENPTYLKDTLTVCARAFLRMKVAGIRPHCKVVHQNVDKSNKDKLQQQNRQLEASLDKCTAKACEAQKEEQMSFTDIIEFSANRDTYYISALLEGELPMAPVNIGYSEDTNDFGMKLIQYISSRQRKDRRTLSEFTTITVALWTAIKKENFVFEFRSCLESIAVERLNEKLGELSRDFSKDLEREMSMLAETLDNYTTEYSRSLQRDLQSKMQRVFDSRRDQSVLDLNAFLESQSHTFEGILSKHMKDAHSRLNSIYRQFLGKAEKRLEKMIREREEDMRLRDEYTECVRETCSRITSQIHDQRSDTESLKAMMQREWSITNERLLKIRVRQRDNINIEDDAHRCLRSMFESQVPILEDALGDKPFSQQNLEQFKITKQHYRSKLKIVQSYYKKCDMILQMVKSDVNEYLSSMEAAVHAYSQARIVEVLAIVKERTFSNDHITIHFQVDLALAVAGHAIEKMKRIHEQFELKNDPKHLIEQLKTNFVDQIDHHIGRSENTKKFSEEFLRSCLEGIRNKSLNLLQDITINNIMTSLQKSDIWNKKSFIVAILIELVKKGDFRLIDEFRQKPSVSMERWLSIFVQRCLPSINQKDILEHVKYATENTLTNVDKAVHDIEQQMEDGRPASEWLEKFLQASGDAVLLKDDNLAFLVGAGDYAIDVPLLTHTIRTQLSKNVQDFLMQLRGQQDLLHTGKYLEEEMQRRILPILIGCQHLCQFCEEICMYESGHVGDHEMMMHRPIVSAVAKTGGTYKYWDTKDELMCLQTCQERVTGCYCFQMDDGRHFPYRQYRDFWPDINIMPDITGESSLFWKWFTAKFKKTLKSTYPLQMQKVPRSWKSLKKSAVRNHLERLRYSSV